MDCKFYVSLEAARLLKEKGYNEKTHAVFNLNLYGDKKSFINIVPKNYNIYEDENILSRPTKTEAIDWLESKGIVIEIHYRTLTGKYFGEIHYNKVIYKDRPSDLTEDYKTRLEAKDATIIQALELL